jgi:hypothetical protein
MDAVLHCSETAPSLPGAVVSARDRCLGVCDAYHHPREARPRLSPPSGSRTRRARSCPAFAFADPAVEYRSFICGPFTCVYDTRWWPKVKKDAGGGATIAPRSVRLVPGYKTPRAAQIVPSPSCCRGAMPACCREPEEVLIVGGEHTRLRGDPLQMVPIACAQTTKVASRHGIDAGGAQLATHFRGDVLVDI